MTTQDSQVILVSTTTHGYLYTVYAKEDTERKKIKYTGEISDDPKDSYCECLDFDHGMNCYHQTVAKEIMEVKIAV